MSKTEGRLRALIEAAPVSSDGWSEVLVEIRKALSCKAVAISKIDRVSGKILVNSDQTTMATEVAYVDRLDGNALGDPRSRYAFDAPIGKVWSEWDIPVHIRSAASPLYRDLLEPAGMDFARCVVLSRDDNEVCLFGSAEPLGDSNSAPEKVMLFGRVAGLISDAMQVERYIQVAMTLSAAEAMSAAGTAVILINAFGKVLHVSPPAHEMLGQIDAFGIVGDRLTAPALDVQEALAAGAAIATQRPGGEMAVVQLDGQEATVIFQPISASGRLELGFDPAAAVLLGRAAPLGVARKLAMLFALTPAEVEISTLMIEGLSVDAIALRRNSSRETVRSQVKSIYAKADASNRAEFLAAFYAS